MMFAIITPALIVGGLAERVKFSSFLVFIVLWATFIYDPLAHWVWGAGGWLHKLGVLDFAGGTVVHISSGVAGLVAAFYLGQRAEHGSSEIKAHNVPFVLLGTALLWFGWFGFNAGSAVAANFLSAEAFLTTNTATAAAAVGWMIVEKMRTGHVTLVGAVRARWRAWWPLRRQSEARSGADSVSRRPRNRISTANREPGTKNGQKSSRPLASNPITQH